MKLLVVYPYIPYPPDRGAYHRAFQLWRGLAAQHQVDLLALAERCEGIEFKPVFEEACRRVEFVPFEHPPWRKLLNGRLSNPLPSTIAHWTIPHLRREIGRCLEADSYDAIHLGDIVLAQYFLNEHRSIPLVPDRTRVDLQYQLMERRHMQFSFKERLLHVENLCKLWLYERKVARRSAFQVVCGPDDEQFVHRCIARDLPVEVLPNGVDLDYFNPEALPNALPEEKPTILFCGAMDYNPNIDALRWYFASMHDLLRRQIPDLRLWIVGKTPVLEVQRYAQLPNVTVTGAVPDVRPYYRRAWLQIVPLRIGGGTRLKIVESMAMGTPVVSTSIGAQGLHLRHAHDILLADTAEDFVRETARAMKQTHLRQHLMRTGLNTVRTRLSWPMLSKQLCRIYSERLNEKARLHLNLESRAA
ncbi:MAG: glycosyltransferase [Verrucomicrobiota bacterium]